MAFEQHFGTVRYSIPGDGLDLSIVIGGHEPGPLIVFVHGYPDTHAVWLPTAARLADDFRCVVYDVRGAGVVRRTCLPGWLPDIPPGQRSRGGHRSRVTTQAGAPGGPRLGILAGLGGGTPGVVRPATGRPHRVVHLDQRTRPRTLRRSGRGSGMRGTWGQRRVVARQLLHSWYLLAFQVPRLPELALRRLLRTPGVSAPAPRFGPRRADRRAGRRQRARPLPGQPAQPRGAPLAAHRASRSSSSCRCETRS